MLKNAFSYTGLKSKKWFGILFYIIIFQSAIMQVVGKFLLMGMNENTVYLYQLVLAILSSPLQLGIIKILKTLHEDHRFRPNQLFYFYSPKRILKAGLLGILNAGFQSLFNILGKYSGGISAGGAADGLTQMPLITGMLGAALTIFLFMANYSYVADETQKITKVWLNSCKMGMGNIVAIAVTVFVGGFLNYFLSQIGVTLVAALFSGLGMQGDTAGNIIIVISAFLIQSLIMVFLTIFQYGIARQVLGETREELLGIEEPSAREE